MSNSWTDEELSDVRRPWEEFHSRYPERSYDSWEVKRRRVDGGTAGLGRPSLTHRNSVACPCKPVVIHRSTSDEVFMATEDLNF